MKSEQADGSAGSAEHLLGPSGPLARTLAGYELRPGQLEMARAVGRALTRGEVLLCEAGTGTGKTLAYLVPAILCGKKVVVSTATRALQEQIFTKDLPLIERALGLDARAALMKGLGNYVCRRRHAELSSSKDAQRPSFAAAVATIDSWIAKSETGDVAEVAELSENDPIWQDVTASSDTRVGAPCEHFSECFVTKMKRDAEAARIVVVNHHLFLADLALRGPHPGRVIPDYDAVVFDEAHRLEEIATDFFGLQVSRTRIERVLRDAQRILTVVGAADPLLAQRSVDRIIGQARTASAELWDQLRDEVVAEEGRATLGRETWVGPLEQIWHRLDSAWEALSTLLLATCSQVGDRLTRFAPPRLSSAMLDSLEVAARRVEQLREQLAQIVEAAPGHVTWAEVRERRAVLGCSPVDLSGVFVSNVFESIPSVVLTSATLATARPERNAPPDSEPNAKSGPRPFAFLRSRLGLTDCDLDVTELLVPSPFDFERCALLYLPRDLPPPASEAFVEAAAERAAKLVELTRGGAFVLTTSLRSMRAIALLLRQRLPKYQVLLQGEAPKQALIAAFRASGNAVLVATISFWQGVDVPGHALRLVVLEKIPFLVPTDPIVRARSLQLEEDGRNPFVDFHLPAAAITLKQGFGRLIRTRADRGIVALLDERIHTRGYGKRLLAALPPAARTTELEQVREFWQTVGAPTGKAEGVVAEAGEEEGDP